MGFASHQEDDQTKAADAEFENKPTQPELARLLAAPAEPRTFEQRSKPRAKLKPSKQEVRDAKRYVAQKAERKAKTVASATIAEWADEMSRLRIDNERLRKQVKQQSQEINRLQAKIARR